MPNTTFSQTHCALAGITGGGSASCGSCSCIRRAHNTRPPRKQTPIRGFIRGPPYIVIDARTRRTRLSSLCDSFRTGAWKAVCDLVCKCPAGGTEPASRPLSLDRACRLVSLSLDDCIVRVGPWSSIPRHSRHYPVLPTPTACRCLGAFGRLSGHEGPSNANVGTQDSRYSAAGTGNP